MTDSVDPPILSHIPPGTRPHRVEMREDGALAEVFEYGPLPEIDGSWRP